MAEEAEISKRIDDLHRRLDDLRADMTTRFALVDQRFVELREDMNRWMGVVDTRFGELREDMNTRFRTFSWQMNVWFGLLTLLIILFKFLRF
jgi:hypothetical protein